MPSSWSDKQEREYQHIEKGYEDRGKSKKTAKEIAARTVNKQRREHGETRNSHSEGTGNPHHSLDARSKDELENLAREHNIRGRSKMTKDELVKAIRAKE